MADRVPADMKYPKYFTEAALDVSNVLLGLTALLLYLRHQKKSKLFGTFPLYICLCILFSAISAEHYIRNILLLYSLPTYDLGRSWVVMKVIYAGYFTYVAGAALALDRVLAMSFPLRHQSWNLSLKLSILSAVLCLLTACATVVSNAIQSMDCPLCIHSGLFNHSTTSFKIYDFTHGFYEVVFAAEVIVDLVFCAFFYRHFRNPITVFSKRHFRKINAVTLFQIASQSALCLVPKILNNINKIFLGESVEWIRIYYSFYFFLYSINITFVLCFVVYRYRPIRTVLPISYNSHPTVNT
ncbi:hypothetical protein QR680_008890 [Steinernema hermaphroditum]|uniref:Uncharacterized protein n=1 Tax=Steinernema hermaphroditum TaxID=289476 RepID=A0AA39IKG6_9BILA|nr:hypothetical protein QR680_008890 [Steinernema hermaphroditum]